MTRFKCLPLSWALFAYLLRWGYDKFPKETPLVFYKEGTPIHPPLEMLDGLKVVLKHTIAQIQKLFPRKTLKFWRLQSPRHFHGGEWNQNGSCLFTEPLEEHQVSWNSQIQKYVVTFVNIQTTFTSFDRLNRYLYLYLNSLTRGLIPATMA